MIRHSALRALLLLYLAASVLHFTHNAESVRDYPNLPGWISKENVYLVWVGITAAGAIGYLLYFRRRSLGGVLFMMLYALAGLGGLLHYSRAPISAHSAAMNFTILFEAASGGLLLAVLLRIAFGHLRRRDPEA